MANVHRNGPVDRVYLDVAVTGVVPTNNIAIGDFVAVSSGRAIPATVFTWDTDLATTQTAFALAFLGVSWSRSRAATTDVRDVNIGVDTDGNIECDCTAAAYAVGAFVGLAKDTGNNLKQAVVAVATKALAVGVVVKAAASGSTKVLIRLINTPTKR